MPLSFPDSQPAAFTPPAIRKVPDDIFEHIAAAVDPPEVVVDLRAWRGGAFGGGLGGGGLGGGIGQGQAGLQIKRSKVRVLREEAVGMYEVAVLEAGSATALKKWMNGHGYKYPAGMDAVCQDYVDQGWCFVAVKTRVGSKQGVTARPGMRTVNAKLPTGASFDGHVQAMGFRFFSKQLVVPMRLSAFNNGELHNIVYLLTEGPRAIRSIPTEYVVRQVDGTRLFRNLTRPLPVRILGGRVKDLTRWDRRQLHTQRDPAPHNGLARELFSSDLLTEQRKRLSQWHEEGEKELLRIGERLDLRGPEVDKLHQDTLRRRRVEVDRAALRRLNQTTLTVIDGRFARHVLARENLTFRNYTMPPERNTPANYDAKRFGPAPNQGGILVNRLEDDAFLNRPSNLVESATGGVVRQRGRAAAGWSSGTWVILTLLVLSTVGLAHFRQRRAAVLLLVGAVVACTAWRIGTAATDTEREIAHLIRQLADSETSTSAAELLVARGAQAVPALAQVARRNASLTRRGWAIVCLSDIGGTEADQVLWEIHTNRRQPVLVRTWAAAGRVALSESIGQLSELARLIKEYPGLARPVGRRVVALLHKQKEAEPTVDLIRVSLRAPSLQSALARPIVAQGAAALAEAMVTARDASVRRQAAAYLATVKDSSQAATAVLEALRFQRDAKDVPWNDGPLFLPSLDWQHDNARRLVSSLIAWHLRCDVLTKPDEQQQIDNNLRSIQLAEAAGYESPGFGRDVSTVDWLSVWEKVVGPEAIERLLAEQAVLGHPRYQAVVEQLK